MASDSSVPSSVVSNSAPSLWDRIADFASRNKKTIIITTAAVTFLITAGGVWYYSQRGAEDADTEAKQKKEKSGRKKRQKQSTSTEEETQPQQNEEKRTTVEEESELPQVTEESLKALPLETRKEYALQFKNAGNKTYASRKFKEAIELYTKAIMCHADPVFYSNRAACYAALKRHDKTIEDASAALSLNPDYSKALRRRAHAYEETHQDFQALSDWTATCIVEEFRFQDGTDAVQRVLKRLADAKAAERMKSKSRKLPSPNFVHAYLSSFRPKAWPAIPEDAGEGDKALKRAFEHVDCAEYNEASDEFDKALELTCSHTLLALNYRGTFAFIRGDPDAAIQDFNKALELSSAPELDYPIQSQILTKRASVYMEKGDRDAAMKDFEAAVLADSQDPDVYYHRGQVRFLMGDFSDAATDYTKSADLDKKFVYSQVQLGVAQYKLGQIKDSLVTFRKCIKNFKNNAEVYNYYGEILLDQGNYQDALDKFETAIELERSSAAGQPTRKVRNIMPLVNRAVLYLQWKKDAKEAERGLREALKLDPESELAVVTLAQLLLQEGRAPEALDFFDKSVELSRTEQELINAYSYAEALSSWPLH